MRRSTTLMLVAILSLLAAGGLCVAYLAGDLPPGHERAAVSSSPASLALDDARDPFSARASRSRVLAVASPAARPSWHAVAPQHQPVRVHRAVRTRAAVARHHTTVRPQAQRHAVAPPAGAYAWAHTRDAYRVANCESGDRSAPDVNTRYNGNPHLRDGNYHGKWQADRDFWRTYGGLQYASDAADATEAQQDAVAYRGWQARGWQPWSCSRIMGVR